MSQVKTKQKTNRKEVNKMIEVASGEKVSPIIKEALERNKR